MSGHVSPLMDQSPIALAVFDGYNSKLQAAALKATRNALTLPSDLAFHRSMDPELSKDLDTLSSRILSLTNNLLSLSSSENSQSLKGKQKSRLESQDDVIDNFHSLVVDSMDQVLERVVRLCH
jgi:exosome complex exonuclease RRP6